MIAASAGASPELVRLRDGRLLARSEWSRARERVEREVRRYGEEHQLRAGVPKGELKSLLAREIDGPVFDEAMAALLAEGAVIAKGDRLQPPGAAPSLDPAQASAAERIERLLEGQGFQPPDLASVLTQIPRETRPVELVRYLVEAGRVVKVTSEMVYTRAQWEEIERRLASHFERHGVLSMGEFKGLLQVSRKYAIPLLEHLDRTRD